MGLGAQAGLPVLLEGNREEGEVATLAKDWWRAPRGTWGAG